MKNSVTVIIPYKIDRGWLKDAIESVPRGVQLLVSQGEGNWPANFNKVLNQAKGEIPKQYLSSKKARKMLGYDPNYDLTKGLEVTYEYFNRRS